MGQHRDRDCSKITIADVFVFVPPPEICGVSVADDRLNSAC